MKAYNPQNAILFLMESPQPSASKIGLETSIETLGQAIQSSLSDDLRAPKYRGNRSPLSGHCYVASEALWHLLGGSDSGFKPMVVHFQNDTHWFLRQISTNRDVDLTADQWEEPVPYQLAKGCGFLTKTPSRRAQVLLLRVQNLLLLSTNPPEAARTSSRTL